MGSFCLRPLGIPDKWIEAQTPPWDPTDTFDPTGPNPDIYLSGYEPLADQGLPMSLVLYNTQQPLQGQSAWPIVVSEPGGLRFQDAIVACSGYPHGLGQTFETSTGNLIGVLDRAIEQLIEQDPDAAWDPTANEGRGGVINSAFAQSPRIIALPVFAPDAWNWPSATSPEMVKIVGFFVTQRTSGKVDGYLTGWSELAVDPVTARAGEWAQLSATFKGPGSPVFGVPIEFLFDGQVVATAETDGTGTARPPTTSFNVPGGPGEFPGAITVRLGANAGFFVANEASADLTVLRRLPVITWPTPPDITYGTPLGPQQLNATADVAGTFSYSPAAGTVLSVHETEPAVLTVTFVPDDLDMYEETTATTFLTVNFAELIVTVNNAQKLYLDPLPQFGVTVTGLVNGDSPSVVFGTDTFVTTATPSSPVGTYAVTLAMVGAENYMTVLKPGVLTIVPRPTTTVVQAATPSPSTYGQAVTFTVAVSSTAGQPTGTVTLFAGSVEVGTASLVNGQAAISVSSLSGGNHLLTAQYATEGSFAASTSAPRSHSVNRAATTAQLTSSLNPSRSGQAVTFTAVVRPDAPGGGVPIGSVEFLRNGVVIGSAPVTNGTAQFTTSTLAVGKHSIQARYAGSVNHLASSSAVIQQSVKGGGK